MVNFFQADLFNNAGTVWSRTTKFGRISRMGEGDAPTARRRCPSTPRFWGFPSIYAHTLWRRTNKFDVVTHMEEGLFLSGPAATPHTKWAGFLQGSPILFCFSIYAYTVCRRTTKYDMVTHTEVLFLGVSHAPPPQRSPILGVLLYLCLHPLTQTD